VVVDYAFLWFMGRYSIGFPFRLLFSKQLKMKTTEHDLLAPNFSSCFPPFRYLNCIFTIPIPVSIIFPYSRVSHCSKWYAL